MPRQPSIVTNVGSAATSQTPQGISSQSTGAMGRVAAGDKKLEAIQSRTQDATASARSLPFGDGNLIRGVQHVSGVAKSFAHLLGRAAIGAFPVSLIATNATAWAVTSLGDATSGAVSAITNQNCTVDWWVY